MRGEDLSDGHELSHCSHRRLNFCTCLGYPVGILTFGLMAVLGALNSLPLRLRVGDAGFLETLACVVVQGVCDFYGAGLLFDCLRLSRA